MGNISSTICTQAMQLLLLSEDHYYNTLQPARYFYNEQQLSFASSKDLSRAAYAITVQDNFGPVTVVIISTHFPGQHTLLLVLQKDCCYQMSMFFWFSWHFLYLVNPSKANLSKPDILTITKKYSDQIFVLVMLDQ